MIPLQNICIIRCWDCSIKADQKYSVIISLRSRRFAICRQFNRQSMTPVRFCKAKAPLVAKGRGERICATLASLKADVICLQDEPEAITNWVRICLLLIFVDVLDGAIYSACCKNVFRCCLDVCRTHETLSLSLSLSRCDLLMIFDVSCISMYILCAVYLPLL